MRENAFVSFFTLAFVEESAWRRMPVVARRASVASVLRMVETHWSVGFA